MKSTAVTVLSVLLLFTLSLVESRKTFLVKQQYPALLAPKVHAYDSTWTLISGKETKLTVDNQV